jgi:DNA invertase Pin-like site-specific DNA recombinase
VSDLLKIFATFRDHDVSLYLGHEGINTGSAGSALLDIIQAYRRAKLSQAIKTGQAKALAAGKRIGRPTIPKVVVTRIQASLANGGGIRSTARKFNVSPASIINIRRTMNASPDKLAA